MVQAQAGPDDSTPAESCPNESAAREPSGENPASEAPAVPTSARRARRSEEPPRERRKAVGKSRPTEQHHLRDAGIPYQGGGQ